MSLPARQQQILDQIEQALQTADPRLKSMFAAFARLPRREAVPASEVILHRSRRRKLGICVMVLCLLGVLMLIILGTKDV